MILEDLNNLNEPNATTVFQGCCSANNWIKQMVAARPFADSQEMLEKALQIWQTMALGDILQAFDGHPRIGDVSSLKLKYQKTAASAKHEQAGMDDAEELVLEKMISLNDAYYKKFGYIFIVCASGKSADLMLTLLEQRLLNSEITELPIAAIEQGKIIDIRLNKLLGQAT